MEIHNALTKEDVGMSNNRSRRVRISLAVGALVALTAMLPAPSQARITKIIIDVSAPFCIGTTCDFDGRAYVQETGRAFGELDPSDPVNAIIQDIELGKDPDGKVRYVTSFRLIRPADAHMASTSGLLWHDVPNRANRVAPPIDSLNAGDMQLNSGWQGDNAGNTAVPAYAENPAPFPTPVNTDWVKVPVAKNVTGEVFGRIVNRAGAASQVVRVQANPLPYKPMSLDTRQATLVSRDHETMEGVVTGEAAINSDDWAWAKCTTWETRTALGPNDAPEICLKHGYDASKLYQVVFTATDPYILGVGFAAFRDLASFFKYDESDGNPIAGKVRWVIARGSSQSGNYLRGFLHLGFNQDEGRRQVQDGTWPIIAGRRIALNFRWAQPDGVLELYQAGSEGPQWWQKFPDHARGLPPNGILVRCQETETCPKIIEHFGSAEVWALKLTPEWVGTDPKSDIPLPENVRRYYIPSSTHGGSNNPNAMGGFFNQNIPNNMVNCPGNNYGQGILRVNPIPHLHTVNALRVHFRNWVMKGTLPPPSRYPTLRGAKGERNLVEPTKQAMGFPTIPVDVVGTGWRTTVPERGFINPVLDYDWGPEFNASDASGVPTKIPPPIKQVIPMLVPRVNSDGNELGGVPVVLNDAPLGTYLGWNITAAGFHKDQICNYVGGMVPFAVKAADKHPADPRPSLEERYGNHDGYVAAVRAAAANAVAQGFLLQADADALIAAAAASNVLK